MSQKISDYCRANRDTPTKVIVIVLFSLCAAAAQSIADADAIMLSDMV